MGSFYFFVSLKSWIGYGETEHSEQKKMLVCEVEEGNEAGEVNNWKISNLCMSETGVYFQFGIMVYNA